MLLGRKDFVKALGASVGAVLIYGAMSPDKVLAVPSSSKAVLYDISICRGCRSCEAACQRYNKLPAIRTEVGSWWDNPRDLEPNVYTIVKRVQFNTGTEEAWQFVKWQCMHCVHPTCTTVCPTSALYKTDAGPVLYDESRCIGCQYCVSACPFSIPRFDWEAEKIITKCTMCADRISDGLEPACVEICPSGALTFGERDSILTKAKQAEAAGAYVFGVDEAGGTSWIYISDVPFDEIGFPAVKAESYPQHSKVMLVSQIATIVGGAAALGLYSLYLRRKKIGGEER